MKKELKDYLHLYWGCQVEYTEKLILGNIEKRKALFIGMEDRYIRLSQITINGKMGNNFSRTISDIKLLLRPLSDMTEEEKKEYLSIIGESQMYRDGFFYLGEYGFLNIRNNNITASFGFNPESIKYLLSKHFDLFGLIEAGLAIDKTTLKQQS